MNTLRIIYHLARADFLERIRRTSFLLMLGLVVWIGYLSASGQATISMNLHYFGIVNSAWIGAVMTLTVSTFLFIVGFYIVKGSVSRDYETGVGQIMATTPLNRPLYMLGKWLSNFAVLGITILIILLEGIVMNLLADTAGFDLWALAAPLVLIALPGMGLVAALAVLFESIHWLRGGLGNILYFFIYLYAIGASTGMTFQGTLSEANPYIDLTGWRFFNDSISRAGQAAYPELKTGISFGFPKMDISGLLPDLLIGEPKYFLWTGATWTTDMLLSRLFFLILAVGLVMLSALFFDRFNPSRLLLFKRKKTESDIPKLAPATKAIPVSNVRLTPLTGIRSQFSFRALFLAELKLLLKGQRWWWYIIAALLVIGPLGVSSIGTARTILLLAWVWPILLLSGLGCRENRFDTRQIVFAAPRPIANQLPAAWLAAFVVTAILGSGALVKFIILGEITSLLGWLTGVLFIPSLALCLGTLTGSSKAFEVIFIAWMYMLTQKMIMIDFMAYNPNGQWFYYAPLALVLLAVAALARQRQLTAKHVAR